MWRFLKWTLALFLACIIVAGVYGVWIFWEIRTSAGRDEARAADAIVVLGAAQYNGRPSPVLKARLDHALDLYKRGLASVVITTGSFGPDENYSEAHVSTQYLIQQGVDPDAIITEQGSGTSRDSIRAAATLMHAMSLKTAIVVSDGFHLFRLKKMFEAEDIVPYASPAPDSPIEGGSSQRFWHSVREVLMFSAFRLANL